jgi:hypothetical protein
VGLAIAPLLVLIARPAYADTVIDFENLAAGTAVSNQYPGVTFNGAGTTGAHISAGDVTGHNGSNNVLINSPLLNTTGGGPLTMTFAPPQKTVSLWASYILFPGAQPTLPGTLTAFDQSGAQVPGAAMSATIAGGMATTQLTVTSTSANIASVTLTLGQGIFTVIDDLSFGGSTVTPPGSPVVTISAPVNGATVDVTNSSLAVNGTVAGQGLSPNVQVTLQAQFNAPDQKAAAFSATLPLDSSQSFAGPSAFTNIPSGIYKLTVTASNMAGESGSASVTVNNLPFALGLTPSQFRYSQVASGGKCQFVAYNDTVRDRALAFFPTTNQVIPVDVPVLFKWQHVNDTTILHGDGTLGCPLTGEVAQVEPAKLVGSLASLNEYKVAPFERGSIYWVSTDNEATTLSPITYTPKVFADAINALSNYGQGGPVPINDPGGINEVGIPVDDPKVDLSIDDPTFLYQQFRRPWYVARDAQGNVVEAPGSHAVTPGAPNTLEIRGLSPTLYVERIGGSFLDYKASFKGKNANCAATGVCNVPVPGDLTPTIWESSGCVVDPTSQAYQCAMNHPHVQAFTAQTNTPVYSTAPAIPSYGDYCATGNDYELAIGIAAQELTEWSAIPNKASPNTDTSVGDFVDIQSLGWVVASNKSSEDFPATHEHMQGDATTTEVIGTGAGCLVGSLGFFLSGPGGVVTTIAGCGLGSFIGYQLGGKGNGLWSDWGIHVRPLALSGIADPNVAWVKTPASGTLPPFWNLLAANGDPTLEGAPHAPPIGDMEMEWEEFWQHSWVAAAGSTIPIGSLIFANGRWMIDCGHPPDHSEIHPPNTLMFAQMVASPTFGQNQVTTAQMWVNEFYMGLPYQTQVWPPPRPSPTAQMAALHTTFGSPSGAPVIVNSDGSRTYPFTPSTNTFTQLPPHVPAIAQARVLQRHDGLVIQVEGPPTGHLVKETGQVMYPDDHPDLANGPISNLYATWTVGWRCETINGTADCQTP